MYASSSSVYGHHSPLPFSPPSILLAPSSVYAAAKMSNEHFAGVFCSQHGLRAVGVRFFTVYGPWGRPDMAMYSFAESLYEGRPLRFYNSTTPTGRDFTFVADIVRGILLALDHVTSHCGEVYNLGHGESVELIQVVKILERKLNATAKIVSLFPDQRDCNVCGCMLVCLCVLYEAYLHTCCLCMCVCVCAVM